MSLHHLKCAVCMPLDVLSILLCPSLLTVCHMPAACVVMSCRCLWLHSLACPRMYLQLCLSQSASWPPKQCYHLSLVQQQHSWHQQEQQDNQSSSGSDGRCLVEPGVVMKTYGAVLHQHKQCLASGCRYHFQACSLLMRVACCSLSL